MKRITSNLLFRVIVAIALGIGLGQFLPESISRIFATFNGLFDQILKFVIPLIIVGLIVPAIAKLGDTAGRLLLYTVAIAYGSTIFAGFSSYFASMTIFPGLLDTQSAADIQESSKVLTPIFNCKFLPCLMSCRRSS